MDYDIIPILEGKLTKELAKELINMAMQRGKLIKELHYEADPFLMDFFKTAAIVAPESQVSATGEVFYDDQFGRKVMKSLKLVVNWFGQLFEIVPVIPTDKTSEEHLGRNHVTVYYH